jgi:hypothetical protein
MRLDDDTYLDTPSSQSIGEIRLVINRTTVPEDVPKVQLPTVDLPLLQKVHERSKKAIAHQVKYVVSLTL